MLIVFFWMVAGPVLVIGLAVAWLWFLGAVFKALFPG